MLPDANTATFFVRHSFRVFYSLDLTSEDRTELLVVGPIHDREQPAGHPISGRLDRLAHLIALHVATPLAPACYRIRNDGQGRIVPGAASDCLSSCRRAILYLVYRNSECVPRIQVLRSYPSGGAPGRMDTTSIRALSKRLFGNSYRVEIAAAIGRHDGEPFHAQGMSDDTGIRYARAQAELKHLLAAEMIREVEGDTRRVEYKAEQSSYWHMCATLLEEWAEI